MSNILALETKMQLTINTVKFFTPQMHSGKHFAKTIIAYNMLIDFTNLWHYANCTTPMAYRNIDMTHGQKILILKKLSER